MSRVTFEGYGNGFPFVVPQYAQDGLRYSTWDGSTWFGGTRSKSAATLIDVVGADTKHPLGFTIPELSQVVWRVRQWKVDYSTLVTTRKYIYPDTSELIGGIADYSTANPLYLLYDAQDARNEANICLGKSYVAQDTSPVDVEWSDDYGSQRNLFFVNFFLDSANKTSDVGAWYAWKNGTDEKIYPRFEFEIGLNIGNVGGVGTRGRFPQDGAFTNQTYPASGATIELQIDGHTFTENLHGLLVSDTVVTSTTATGSVVITPYKYWSYNGLYDEDTGAIIPDDAPGFGFNAPIETYYIPLL